MHRIVILEWIRPAAAQNNTARQQRAAERGLTHAPAASAARRGYGR